MIYLAFLLCLLFPIEASSKIVWSGRAKPGYSIVVDASRESVSIDQKLQIKVIIISPEGYHVNRELMRRNILNDLGYGSPPFSLLSEEVVMQEHNIQRVIYTLDPQIPGSYSLSLGKISFEPDKPNTQPIVDFMSGTFPIAITMKSEKVNYRAPIAPLLKLSTTFPINVNPQNNENYINNPDILKQEIEKHRRVFSSSGESTIAFGILLVLKLLIALIAVWQMIRKKEVKAPVSMVQVSAKEKARYALKQLHKNTIDVPQNYHAYHVKVSEIIRIFLEEVSGIHASKMTTHELLEKSKPLTEKQKSLLSDFLINADKIKYTNYRSSDEDFQYTHQHAQKIVHELIPDEPKHFIYQGIAFWGLATLLRNYYKKRISKE
jgi:hypothetical protein